MKDIATLKQVDVVVVDDVVDLFGVETRETEHANLQKGRKEQKEKERLAGGSNSEGVQRQASAKRRERREKRESE